MKRDLKQFKSIFESKIQILKEELDKAVNKPINSEKREESANLIAVILRLLFCENDRSLYVKCNYEKQLFFPLVNPMSAVNILPDYLLVGMTVNNKMATFTSNDLYDTSKVYPIWMSIKAWLDEIVIDFKIEGFPPLSRRKVIRIIADTQGAHVDDNENRNVSVTRERNVFPVSFFVGNEECNYHSGNLFSETILSIAKELLFSFSYSRSFFPTYYSESEWTLYTQTYDTGRKFHVCKLDNINAYNANNYYSCTVVKEKMNYYRIRFLNRFFNVCIVE